MFKETTRMEIELSRASMNAGSIAFTRKSTESADRLTLGKPSGMSLITGAESSHSAPTAVPISNTTKEAGNSFLRRPRQSTPRSRQSRASVSAWGLSSLIASGKALSWLTSPAPLVATLNAGNVWLTMTRMPNAAKNPEIRDCGTYVT